MNEDLTLKKQFELVHFQSSARSAKKSNDFFGLMKLERKPELLVFKHIRARAVECIKDAAAWKGK
jgi:hypothetical protein